MAMPAVLRGCDNWIFNKVTWKDTRNCHSLTAWMELLPVVQLHDMHCEHTSRAINSRISKHVHFQWNCSALRTADDTDTDTDTDTAGSWTTVAVRAVVSRTLFPQAQFYSLRLHSWKTPTDHGNKWKKNTTQMSCGLFYKHLLSAVKHLIQKEASRARWQFVTTHHKR
jgi:hypothetical protein